jgi:hypothetical protein
MNVVTKASQEWCMGNIDKAIALYKKSANQKNASQLQQDFSFYMLAYLYILKSKQIKNEMAVLSVDLERRYCDCYYMANLCYQQISEIDFDAEQHQLPIISAADLNTMLKSNGRKLRLAKQRANQYYPAVFGSELIVFTRAIVQYIYRAVFSKFTEAVRV